MHLELENIINLERCPLMDGAFRAESKQVLDQNGVLVLHEFLTPRAIASIQGEGIDNQHLAYYTANNHNIYLKPADPELAFNHVRNREVSSSKGCITTDQIPARSALRKLYSSAEFRDYLCAVLNEDGLYEYADPLSSINLHYASKGQELGWHFDNSSFAITLMIQNPEDGGAFEYVKDVRDADNGEMNYELSGTVLDGKVPTKKLSMDNGALVLFRGRNSIHRVTPVKGKRTRMLVVLAYNTEPGISLSQSARMTFYGRLG
ncbi:MAG: HalD/BesD family halogenase [bacterium]